MGMEDGFDSKINILKAFAIILVVAGHLNVSIIPFFPTYSFHMALFFFISGYLFKEEYLYNSVQYIKNKAKRLLIPYFWYYIVYFVITIIIAVFTKTLLSSYTVFNIKNCILNPIFGKTGLTLLITLWFVYQLFISLVSFNLIYKILRKIYNNKIFHFMVFLILALLALKLSVYKNNYAMLLCIRTLFSLFFIYIGFIYKNSIEKHHYILKVKYFSFVIIFQSILWLFNTDNENILGMTPGLSYLFSDGTFSNQIIPILSSLTGIWASLFLINIFYPYLKDNKFIELAGKNTYHIMVNHVFIIYLISNLFFKLNNFHISNYLIFDMYNPEKTTCLYFLITIIISTYIGVAINYTSKKIKNRKLSID